jgi:hypothetical protein
MATAIAKEQSGAAEAMRSVSVTRRSAVKAKTQAIKQAIASFVDRRSTGCPPKTVERKYE